MRFEVIDTGVGIAPDDVERIFEPFHQGRRNPLGAPGTGSRCSFELPLPLAVAAAPSVAAPRTINGYLGPRRRPLPASEAEPLLDLARRGDIRSFRTQLKAVATRHPDCASTIEHLHHLAAGF